MSIQTVSSIPALLQIAKVSKVTIESLPQILQTLTENKIQLEGAALKSVLSLLNAAPAAMTVAYDKISASIQKAHNENDKLSIDHISNLLRVFQSSGISDSRIAELLDKTVGHEHEIRLERTKGTFGLAKLALTAVAVIAYSVITKKPPPKVPFWYK
jgi:Glu-tRNA(Gln) amidotransferase subunit E-like FAD-binding protein